MRKAWALMDYGDTMVGRPYDTRELAQAQKDAMSYLGEMLEVREIDYNDAPEDEETEVLKQRLYDLFEEKGVKNFHMSRGPNFFQMSFNERLQFMIDLMTKDHLMEPLDFGDRTEGLD